MPRVIPALLALALPLSAHAEEPSGRLLLEAPVQAEPAAGWGELAWSPDGTRLSAARPGLDELVVIDLDDGAIAALAVPGDAPGVFRHSWAPDGAGLRVASRGGRQAAVLPLSGGALEQRGWDASADPWAWAERDDIVVRQDGQQRRVTQGEDRFYDPVLSADGGMVAFSGLVSGLHVMVLGSGELWHLGSGRWPSWHPDGWLVFERNHDDGRALAGADLYAWHRQLEQPLALTAGAALERFPVVSPDGGRVAYLQDGAIVVARLREVAP